MNQYVTGAMIKRLRENKNITQQQLAEKLNVTDKAVSKWETNHGYPDISLVEPLADALGVSIIELFSGESIVNTNKSFNMLRMKFYVCPVCGNIIYSTGETVVSCCGIVLPVLEAESAEDAHRLNVEKIEDEYYVTISHEMSKKHYISFIAAASPDRMQMVKLYPEGDSSARFKIRAVKRLYFYCNRDGLFYLDVKRMQRGWTCL